MEPLMKLKDMLCKELEEFGMKGKLSAGDLETVDKLSHAIKCLMKIMEMEEAGYSNAGYSGYSRGYSGRRDSMGRYADSYENSGRGSRDGNSGRGYSRDDGKAHMLRQFEAMMDEASPEEREVIHSAMSRLKNM